MSAHVITVAQQKGGAGKTTLAAHLAVAWSEMGMRVAAVDIDPQGSLDHWHSIREKRSELADDILFSRLSGWRVGSEITRLRSKADIVIVDSPPHTETEARTAIRHSDLILVPLQPSPLDLWATQATLQIAKDERVPVKMVLNRVNPNAKLSQSIADQLGECSHSRLGNRVLFAGALMAGLGVTEAAPYSPAAEEIWALAEELLLHFGVELEPVLTGTA